MECIQARRLHSQGGGATINASAALLPFICLGNPPSLNWHQVGNITMGILFFSDCHGSMEALQALELHLIEHNPEHLVLLGDILNRGKNPPPGGYSLSGAAVILNRWQKMITAVRGNCDREQDLALLAFPVSEECETIFYAGRKILCNHGCHWDIDTLPPAEDADVLVYGHTHSPLLQRLENGMIILNPGAITLPRRAYPPTLAYMDQTKIIVKTLHQPVQILMEMPLE